MPLVQNNKPRLRALLALILLIAYVTTPTAAVHAATVTVAVTLDASKVAAAESNFGDMVSDAMLASSPSADFALCPAAEINPVLIDAGKVDTNRITDAMRAKGDPNDTVVVMTLTGAQVVDALAHALSRAPESFQGFLQMSGIIVHYNASKHGTARVVSVAVSKSGRAVDPKAKYRVAMSHYLSDGALGYFDVWGSAEISDTHVAMTDAVVGFVMSNQPVSARVDGRLVQDK